MSDAVFRREVDLWLTGKRKFSRRAKHWILSNIHSRKWLDNFRWRPIIRAILKAMAPAAAPLLAFKFAEPLRKIPFETALMWSGALFAIGIVATVLDALLSRVSLNASGPEEMLMRVSELVRLMKDKQILTEDKAAARMACLNIIEVYVRHLTGAKDGEIGVCIARYVGSSTHKLRIDQRNAGSKRKVGTTFPGDYVLGHHACQAGHDPRPIQDIRHFGAKACLSPSGSKRSYRSIFIVPLLAEFDGLTKPLGFLSIDSTRPYEFYGNRASLVAVELESIVERVRKLM